jgi:hypothetical protein
MVIVNIFWKIIVFYSVLHFMQSLSGKTYTLSFPLELTNRDYMHRVLDIVTLGIRGQVIEITSQPHRSGALQDIKLGGYNASDDDIYYLLKQILGNNQAKKNPSPVTERKRIRLIFKNALKCEMTDLIDSCEALLTSRNNLAHNDQTKAAPSQMTSCFKSAKVLLDIFVTSKSGPFELAAVRMLSELTAQMHDHKKMKTSRLALLHLQDEISAVEGPCLTVTVIETPFTHLQKLLMQIGFGALMYFLFCICSLGFVHTISELWIAKSLTCLYFVAFLGSIFVLFVAQKIVKLMNVFDMFRDSPMWNYSFAFVAVFMHIFGLIACFYTF